MSQKPLSFRNAFAGVARDLTNEEKSIAQEVGEFVRFFNDNAEDITLTLFHMDITDPNSHEGSFYGHKAQVYLSCALRDEAGETQKFNVISFAVFKNEDAGITFGRNLSDENRFKASDQGHKQEFCKDLLYRIAMSSAAGRLTNQALLVANSAKLS